MLGKIGILSFVIIWLRATYPRLREDQLQRFSWLVLIPLSLVQILAVGDHQGLAGIGGVWGPNRRSRGTIRTR